MKNSEARFEIIHDIFLAETPEILDEKLNTFYPDGETIFLLIIHNMNEPIRNKHPQFFGILEYYDVIFDENDTKIFLLREFEE